MTTPLLAPHPFVFPSSHAATQCLFMFGNEVLKFERSAQKITRSLDPVPSAHISASGMGAIHISLCPVVFLFFGILFLGGGRRVVVGVPRSLPTQVQQGYLLTYSRLQAPGPQGPSTSRLQLGQSTSRLPRPNQTSH